MRSFEEIYILRTIDLLKEGLNTEILKVWEQIRNSYSASGYDATGTDDNNPNKITLIEPPDIADEDYFQWSLEEKPFTGVWAILVNCDLQLQDSNDAVFLLGNYQLSVGIAYQTQYIEADRYAALSRIRIAIMETIKKRHDRILYNGGTLEVASTRMRDINPAEGNRIVVAEVLYNLISQA